MGVSGAFIHLSKAKHEPKRQHAAHPLHQTHEKVVQPAVSAPYASEATKLLPSGKRTYPPCSIGNTSSIWVNFQPAVSVDKRVIAGNCYCSSDFIPWIDFLLPRDGGEQTKGVIHRVAPLHEFCLQLKRQMSQLPWFITSLTFKKKQATF